MRWSRDRSASVFPSAPASASAFTLVELLTVITIVAVLAALVMGIVSRVQARARAVNCLSNLRQLNSAALMYAGENSATLPFTEHWKSKGEKPWTVTLQMYAEGRIIFRCPVDEDPARTKTYLINDFLTAAPAGAPALDYSRLSRLDQPQATVLFAEAAASYTDADHYHFAYYHNTPVPPAVVASQIAVERHLGAANYAFADGHVENLKWPDALTRLTAPGSRFLDPSATTLD